MISRWFFLARRKRTPLKTDPQRYKVYALEREIVGQAYATRCAKAHIMDVVTHACKRHGVKAPAIKIVKEKVDTFGWQNLESDGRSNIYLNASFHGVNLSVLLHELAHHISHSKYKHIEDHGPEFVKVYMDLLDKYRILPKYAFKVMLDRHKIRY